MADDRVVVSGRLLSLIAAACWLAVIAGAVLAFGSGEVLIGPAAAVPGFGTVGGLLAMKRPRHPVGWLLLAMASGLLIGRLGAGPEVQNGVVVVGLALVLVVFPTGRPAGRWWYAPMATVTVSWLTLGTIGEVVLAENFAVPIGVIAAAASLLVCVAAPLVRIRRATLVERSQLRWLGFAAGFSGVCFLLFAIGFAGGLDALAEAAGGLALLGFGIGIPVAILVAILRYRLYEIDRIVSRTVTYGVVAVVVSAVYAVPILLVPELLGTAGDVVTAGSTLVAATAFNPVRRRVQRLVERRFNRSSYDAGNEVARVAEMLRDRADHREVVVGLVGAVRGTLHPSSLSVWLRPGSAGRDGSAGLEP